MSQAVALPHNVQPRSDVTHPASSRIGTGAHCLGIKRSQREADRSPPSSSDVKNASCYQFTSSWFGAYVIIITIIIHVQNCLLG
jgi:hypothetical protein